MNISTTLFQHQDSSSLVHMSQQVREAIKQAKEKAEQERKEKADAASKRTDPDSKHERTRYENQKRDANTHTSSSSRMTTLKFEEK